MLPVDIWYFLQSYEACLQLTEWLENELHQRWHSSECEESQQRQLELPLPPPELPPVPALPPLLDEPPVPETHEEPGDSAVADWYSGPESLEKP